MDPIQTPERPVFDRRLIYRPFLERLNPIASMRTVLEQELIVEPGVDPRDPKQPAIHEAFAGAAELQPGVQMALVGGIGSGKTTELLLTMGTLKRHSDAVNLYIEAAEFTDFLHVNPGAMLAAIGMRLMDQSRERFGEPSVDVAVAHENVRKLAWGKTQWHRNEPRTFQAEPITSRVDIPGLVKPRFPELKGEVSKVANLLEEILCPFVDHGCQVTAVVDGLDRLIEPSRFREFAEQDLRAIRGMKLSVIVAAPLLLWFDKSRFLQDYFDEVKHIPAATVDSKESGFLLEILKRRKADELMDEDSLNNICQFSGGVLRDLLFLAHAAAQNAYRQAEDRIGFNHVQGAVRQLGNRYRAGIGGRQRYLLSQLREEGWFDAEDPDCRELLVNRQVLEYFENGIDYFKIHPALAIILPEVA